MRQGAVLLRVAVDTNCWIDAVRSGRQVFEALQRILKARDLGTIELMVSRHTLEELKPGRARQLAETATILPYWPIGTWKEQGSIRWCDLTGTWGDLTRNQDLQREIATEANAGANLRDRGAYLDALHARVDVFVTSDGDLAEDNAARRLSTKYGLRVMTPTQLAADLTIPWVSRSR